MSILLQNMKVNMLRKHNNVFFNKYLSNYLKTTNTIESLCTIIIADKIAVETTFNYLVVFTITVLYVNIEQQIRILKRWNESTVSRTCREFYTAKHARASVLYGESVIRCKINSCYPVAEHPSLHYIGKEKKQRLFQFG